MLDSKELSRYVGFADSEIGELAKIYLEEGASTTNTTNVPTRMESVDNTSLPSIETRCRTALLPRIIFCTLLPAFSF